ncbi:DUF3592 domain-containing protein [Streptomyces diastatochromogenes]|uniref:DUF3592 domain-containing protein n=1 Tax=Streptomyces diastatochromogenes TaxID=42236 RepID=A0A233SPV5_STRDA|nr:DUF3592 domain-containing protein [Streptomyces diastatochromogenes]MCZ0987941.1 hypothetical protein [Streptomyces diastatochromogenes]OXY97652.1 hypothetical protein BEK98_08850 [Streptomyces diastatochromogenes]
MLDGLREYGPAVLIFGIPVLAGAILFIWRDGALRRRGVTVRARCVNQGRNKDGEVALRLQYEVDGAQYAITTQHYTFPPAGIGQTVDVIYDPVHPSFGQMASELGRGIVPWIVGGIASVLLVLTGISYL